MSEKASRIIQNFMKYINEIDTENFIKSLLFCFAAPTITGIKAACLINFKRADDDICSLWKLNADKWLEPLGVEWLLLNEFYNSKNALVLIYRRELLERTLNCIGACEILKAKNYPLPDVDKCLECLRKNFNLNNMPHEVGIFLDYPPEDVKGFIENRKAKNLSCQGYWKVYGDVEKAEKTFRKYRNAECNAAQLILKSRQQIKKFF